jgi:hypothetical protein
LRKNFRTVETWKEIGSGLCRKPQREELLSIYSATNTIRVNKYKRMWWQVTYYAWLLRNAYKILIEEHEEERSLGNQTCRRDDNMKINLTEIMDDHVN